MSKRLIHLLSSVLVLGLATSMANAAPLQQDHGPDGIVSVEAEHFDDNVEVGGHRWEETGPTAGFTGVVGMRAPSGHSTNYAANGERLDYEIDFVKTGTYYPWILGWGPDGNSDTCHVGLDGQEINTADQLHRWENNYRWSNDTRSASGHLRASFEVTSTGLHVLNIWPRESGLIIDKIVLTTNPDYVLTGTEPGPPESPRGTRAIAFEPNPADGAIDVPRDVVLSWTPGEYAPPINGHKVYLSESFNDVNDGIGGITQSDTSYIPIQRLNLDTTYYWRVDEVNAPPDSTVYRGSVWSFTTEPVGYPIDGANITATASSSGETDFGPEKTINGSGLDDGDLHSAEPTDMWLSGSEPLGAWIQYEFDTAYKLHEMWVWNSNQVFEGMFGFGLKDVTVEYSTNGAEWAALAGVPEFAKAPGAVGYAHDTTVDFGGAVAKLVKLTATSNWGGLLPQYGLSEVRFFSIPVVAREPSPDAGTADVNPAVTLSWRAGREAGTHSVYLSTDQQAVIDGTVPAVSVANASYSSDLDLAGTYYWRIDEVNDAETPAIWQGDVWSFSTSESLVVDDFELYNDIDPPDPESHRIFESWSDGFGVATNGALVGNDLPPYLEQTIVHGGDQSMPLFFSNTAGAVSSETTRTFAPGRDWTKHGIETLVLYFQGIPGNTGQLYVKVNGVKVAYPGDAADMARLLWNQWNIDLVSLGVNLTSVTSLAIGIDGDGAAGTLYVDDIMLYRLAPPTPAERIWLEAEAAAPLGASWRVYADPASSGGSHIGSESGDGTDNDMAPGAAWVATYSFDASGGTYRVLLRVQEQGNDSLWVRITTATAQSHEDPDQPGSGWVRFNEIDAPSGWAWDEVHSNDHSNAVVSWTLPAGANTIEIAKREDGVWLDAIVVFKID